VNDVRGWKLRESDAFATFNLPWLVGSLGLVFIPWTSLNGFDWVWLGFGILADVASYVGGYQDCQQIPGFPSNNPLMNY